MAILTNSLACTNTASDSIHKKVQLLKSSLLFQEVPISRLEELASHCKIKTIKKGTTIFRKEDNSNHLYIIKSGYIMESVYYGSSADVIVKVRSNGEYFGEMGMLSDQPYKNTALALEESELLSIPKSCFLNIVWSDTGVCKVIILELIDRLVNSAQNMVNSMYLDAPGRLAFTLVNLTTTSTQKNMNIRVTQNALASSSGRASSPQNGADFVS